MRLIQLKGPNGRRVTIVEDAVVRLLGTTESIYPLAQAGAAIGCDAGTGGRRRRGRRTAGLRRDPRGRFAMAGTPAVELFAHLPFLATRAK
jgi:hypothetical protein